MGIGQIPNKNLRLRDVVFAAESFLQKFDPSNKIPVPIEDIAELQLNIFLNVVPGIKDLLGIDAFINSDFKEITIDEYSFSHYSRRTRFSLAHEIGHLILHKDWYEKHGPKNLEEYLGFHDNIDPEIYKFQEIQANTFAGFVLVPKEQLFKIVKEKIGYIPENQDIGIFISLINFLSDYFDVSEFVILHRLQNEKMINK